MTHDAPELQDILKRVGRLEAQNRRLKWGGISLLAVLSAFVLMGQAAPTPRVIEAQRFVLKDAKGNIRAWWGLLGQGSELTLGTLNKQPKMSLKVSDDASDLHFFGNQNSGMNLGLDSGDPSVSMLASVSNGGSGITVSAAKPSLVLKDGNGLSVILGASQLKGSPGAEVKQTSAASVVLLDKSGKIIWKAP
ncbi:MAG TPA: hypothetical protein VNO32_30900 [Candidatus Acidoferrum sp.]|nr:hypothetical protein [Candidatus Acidoferrum sp.]